MHHDGRGLRSSRCQQLTNPSGVELTKDGLRFPTRAGVLGDTISCNEELRLRTGGDFDPTVYQIVTDLIAAVLVAIDEAERLLGYRLINDITDPVTGEIDPIVVVTDNAPAFKSTAFARFIASRPELSHVRTRRNSPHTNGVRERAFGSPKYEHLYRHDITDGDMLATETEHYRQIFNTIRPHEALDMRRPIDIYLNDTPSFPAPETEPET